MISESPAIPLSLDELRSMLVESVEKFFEMMLSEEAKYLDERSGVNLEDLDEPPPPVLESDQVLVVSMVGFIGAMNGVLYIYIEESTALRLACQFLGMDESEILEEGNETINDALGEMSNMVTGGFKNMLNEHGYDCRMTIPSILRGSQFTIESPAEVFRRLYRFSVLGADLVVDLNLKLDEHAPSTSA